MSYFTDTFYMILEGIDSDDVINVGKAVGTGAAATVMSGGNPVAGVQAGMGEMKYPNEITYVNSNGIEYHGKIAYTFAKKDYIKYKKRKNKMNLKEEMSLRNKVEARLNMAIAYEKYDLNKVLNFYPKENKE